MGGDFGPHMVVPGAVRAAKANQYDLVLVGDEPRINAEMAKLDARGVNYRIVHATQVADMHDKPTEALRKKKDSSIQVAINLVRDGGADGVISAGNTGVILASSLFTLGRMEGVDRPGLATIMPTETLPCVLIDVGANVDCKPLNLLQFGIMADVMARTLLRLPSPKVAILSIGEEEGKGNQLSKEAFELFRYSALNFVGNVEGRDIFSGKVDVVVCDGFVGNVSIKLAEGLAASMGRLAQGRAAPGLLRQDRHHPGPVRPEALLPDHGLHRIRRSAALGLKRHRHRGPRLLQRQGHRQRRGHGRHVRAPGGQPDDARRPGRQQGLRQFRQTYDPLCRLRPKAAFPSMHPRVTLEGFGRCVPDKVLTNAELEAMVDTSDEWIVKRVGIKERRIAAPGQACSDLALGASQVALADAGRQAEDITHIFLATFTADTVCPPAACTLQEKLGIRGRPSVDMNAACSGFLYTLEAARGALCLHPEAVVLAGASEVLTSRTNWHDRATCVLFGDGAGAVVLSGREPGPGQAALVDVILKADGSLGHLLTVKGGGSAWPLKLGDTVGPDFFVEMAGQEVFKNAVRSMGSISEEILGRNGLTPADVSLMIPHQANLRIIEAVGKRLGIHGERVMVTIDRYGNSSASSIPMALADAKSEGRIKPGSFVLLVGFGGGFTWGAALLKFA